MLDHPGTVVAVDWPTAHAQAVAVVARANGAADIDALVADKRNWARGDRP